MNHGHLSDWKRRSRAPALPPRARWAVRLVVCLPLLVFLVAAFVYCAALGRLLRVSLAPVVAGEASRQLGHQVLLGSLDFRPGALILNNVVVSNRHTFVGSGGEAALSTRRVTVHYNLHDLIFDSGNAGHAVGDVVIEHPTALVERLTLKRFNFSDIIDELTKTPHKPNAKPFAGRILVQNATVHVRDYLAPAGIGVRPANNLVTGSATVDFASSRFVYFTAAGRGYDGRLDAFSASGDASRLTAGRFRVMVKAANGDARYWSTYFKAFPQAHVLSGRADLDLTVARLASKPPPGLPVDLSGRVTVRQGAVALTDPKFKHLPVQNVNGTAIFTSQSVTIDATALAGGQPIRASGTVFDFLHPQVAFTGYSPHMDAIRLARYFPQLTIPPGLGISLAPVTVQVTGNTVNPVVNVLATLPVVTYRGYTATNVQTRALFAGGILLFPSATFQLNHSGQGNVRVTMDTRPKVPLVSIGGHVTGLNLATVHLPPTTGKPVALGGIANIAFLSSGTTQKPSIVANVSVSRPRIAETFLRAASARVAYSPSQGLTLRRGVVTTLAGGVATAIGTIPTAANSPLNLTVHAAGMDLARLLSPYSKVDVGGLAFAQARVTGPLSSPQYTGTVQLFGGRYGRVAADVITGGISGNTNSLTLKNVVVRRFPTELHLSGTVGDLQSQNPQLALNATLSQGDLTDVIAIANQIVPAQRIPGKKSALRVASNLPALTGTIQGAFKITGRASSPNLVGSASITDATVDTYRIQELHADIGYTHDTVRVDNAALLTDEGTTVTARGQYGLKTGQLAAAFDGENIQLDQFDNLIHPYADVDGVLDVSGRVGGTLQSPTAAATVNARSLAVEGQIFAPFTISGRFADGVLTKTGDPWTFTLQTPDANNAQYIVDALKVTLPTPAHPNAERTLTLAARIPEDAPENLGHLADALRTSRYSQSGVGKKLIAQLDNLPATPEGTVWLPSLVVSGPFAAPAVQATVGGSALTLGENKVASLAAHGSYAGGPNPTVHAEATIGDILAAGVPIQSVVAQGDYANRVVTVSRLDARSAEAYLHGSGTADLDGAVDAGIDASNVPLSLANLFLPSGRHLSGTISELTVQAMGKTSSPDLIASVNLDNPAVTVTTPPAAPGAAPVQTQYALDSIRSGTIRLSSPSAGTTGKVLAVTDLAAYKGGKRLATLSGTLPVSFGGTDNGGLPMVPTDQPLHAELQVADLSVLSLLAPNVIDPKRTGGTLIATADYGGGTSPTPRLLGLVTVTGGSLGLQGFDTSLTTLKGTVSVQNSRLVASLTGQSSKGGTVTLSGDGTLDAPDTKGAANLRLKASNLLLDETGRGNFLAKTYNTGAKGRVNGEVTITGPWTSPLIATTPDAPIVVSDAVGTLPSATSDTTTAKTIPTVDPRFNVVVQLGATGKTVSVRSPLLQADASGNVELGGSVSAPEMRAHLAIARGQFILPPTTRLVIVRPEDGTNNFVNLRYPVASLDPADEGAPTVETRVHLVAQANVTVSPSVVAANQSVVSTVVGQSGPQTGSVFDQPFGGPAQGNRYMITAKIDGLLNVPDQLHLELSSNPSGLSRQVMLASLVPEGALQGIFGGGQGAETAVKEALATSLGAVVLPTLLSPLEQSVAGALGLEDFSVDYSPDSPVNVTLSKQIAPRLLVTYIRAVGARTAGAVNNVTQPPQYTLKLGYGITKHLQISISTDDQKDNTLALEGVFGF